MLNWGQGGVLDESSVTASSKVKPTASLAQISMSGLILFALSIALKSIIWRVILMKSRNSQVQ